MLSLGALFLFCMFWFTRGDYKRRAEVIRIWKEGLENEKSEDVIISEVNDFLATLKEDQVESLFGKKSVMTYKWIKGQSFQWNLIRGFVLFTAITCLIMSFLIGEWDGNNHDPRFEEVNQNRTKYGMKPLSKERYNNRASRNEIDRELRKAVGK